MTKSLPLMLALAANGASGNLLRLCIMLQALWTL